MFLTPDQQDLHTFLSRRSDKLARIYLGGLIVLADESNPCRYELAAHSFRELLEKLPLLTNGEAFASGDSTANRLAPVKRAFSIIAGQQKLNEDTDLESIAAPLRRLLQELDKFFGWQESNRPARSRKIARDLNNLSGAGPAPPIDLFEEEVSGWKAADKYFIAVAHNKGVADGASRDLFLRHLSFIENMLLRRLRPRSVEQLNELDALIKEAEDG